MGRIPNTDTVVSYAYVVKVDTNVLGHMQGFDPSSNRELARVREIKHLGGVGIVDDTIEIVPGRTESSINIERLEAYADNMMQAFGFDVFETLEEIDRPIQIVEELRDAAGRLIRTIHYEDCWIATWGKSVREGTITVTENLTVQATKIIAYKGKGK